jgi:hypothetical protein
VGQIKELDDQESKKIAIDSLIKDKIKITALTNHGNIIIKDELLNNQIVKSSQNIGFRSIEDFMTFLKFQEYELDEFKKKILLELNGTNWFINFIRIKLLLIRKKLIKN